MGRIQIYISKLFYLLVVELSSSALFKRSLLVLPLSPLFLPFSFKFGTYPLSSVVVCLLIDGEGLDVLLEMLDVLGGSDL